MSKNNGQKQSLWDKVTDFIEDRNFNTNIINEFEKRSVLYDILNTKDFFNQNKSFRAIQNIDEKSLLVPCNEKNLSYIRSNVILLNYSDCSKIKISQIDLINKVEYIVSYMGQTKIIPCYKAHYELVQKNEQPTNHIVNNTTISLGDNNSGSVTVNNSPSISIINQQLSELHKYIEDFKPNFLDKHKKTEAQTLYITFKDCIINKKKDETLFNKFLKVLKVISSTAVKIAQLLIATL